MRKYKSILAFFISLLIMFTIIATCSVVFFKNTVLSESTYTKVLERENTYNKIYDNINENIKYLMLTNNIPTDTLSGVITEDEVRDTVNDYIYYTVSYMRKEESQITKLDMDTYTKRIDEKMDKFIKENNLSKNAEFMGHVNEIKGTALNIIKGDLEVVNLNELSKSSYMTKLASLSYILNSNKVIVSLIAIIILLSASMCLIWKRRKIRRVVWVGYSFMAGGLTVMLIGISGYLSNFYKHIAIDIDYLAEAIAAIIKNYLITLTQIGSFIFLIGILLMAVYWRHIIKKLSVENKLA